MEEVVRIDLGRVIRALWIRKWRILLAGMMCAGLAMGGCLARGTRYETAVTFFTGTPERARQGAVLLELEDTVSEIALVSGVDGARLYGEEILETGFLRVTAVTGTAAEGKALAEAVGTVLPRRAEEVLGFDITAADDGVTEKEPVWRLVLGGFLVGALGCGGLVAGVEILGKEKASLV